MRTIQKRASRKPAFRFNRKMSQQRLGQVNVVVIDPATNQGVALSYDPETMEAPIIVAKSDGFFDQEIQELAEHGVVESRSLVQEVFAQCDVGEAIPDDLLYPDVAEMLVGVYLLNEIAANLTDALESGVDPQAPHARSFEKYPRRPYLERSPIRVSLD